MKPAITTKSILLLFAAVLAVYLASFYAIEGLRHRSGPWDVSFENNIQGSPALVVSQPSLGLKNFKILFHGEAPTLAAARVQFDRVKQPVPFGRVIYEDLTFLPGVVTFDLFGHEVELLPRVLLANKKEIPWRTGETVDLWPTNKPAEPPSPPRQGRRQPETPGARPKQSGHPST